MMEKSVTPDEKVEELFTYESNSEDLSFKWIGVTKSGKYYNVETHQYNIGSAYSHYHTYHPLEPDQVSFYQRIAEGRKKAEEYVMPEEQDHLLTNGSDREFYKKKKSDIIWWEKEDSGQHKFTFDKETVFDLMTDYPHKLTPQQKEIFDQENPYWKTYFQKKNAEAGSDDDSPEIRYVDDITPEEYMKLRNDVGWMQFPMEQARACIENAYYIACVRDGEKAIGMVRLLWDGGYTAFLSDVIVDEKYRGLGIGRRLVESCIIKLKKDMKPGYKVKISLNSARGKEAFYEKFGFKVRPNEDAGPGMDQWLINEDI